MSLPKQRVAIIDGTPMMRRGLRSYLKAQPGLRPVIETGIPAEALKLIQLDPPDLIISEALFPGNEGIFDFLKELRSKVGRIPVLVFSDFSEKVIAARVIKAGAMGYLMKSASEKELESAIRRLLSGRIYLSKEMTDRTLTTLSDSSSRTHHNGGARELTNRELEVLDRVGAGMASKEIADVLGISLKTVESHRSHILAKLSLENSAELICYATQWRNLTSQRGLSRSAAASA